MSVTDRPLQHTADDQETREERGVVNQGTHQEHQPRGQKVRWLVAKVGYRLVALGAWLERFGPEQTQS